MAGKAGRGEVIGDKVLKRVKRLPPYRLPGKIISTVRQEPAESFFRFFMKAMM
jgi:hypothetical protein